MMTGFPRFLILLVALASLITHRHLKADEGVNEQSAELQVLDKLVGQWNEEVELNGQKFTAAGTTEWTLAKTHLQSHFEISLPGGRKMEHLMVMTYDRAGKVYRSWQYTSGGSKPIEFEGSWSDEKQTLTMTGQSPDGMTFTSVTELSDSDSVPWTVEAKRENGETVFRMKGVDRRVNNGAKDSPQDRAND